MRLLTASETEEWCRTQGVELDDRGLLSHPREGRPHTTFELPKESRSVTWLAQFIEGALRPRQDCLLWVTRWGVWPSSENWHLYYRLRQSYGDLRLLSEAPGHLFLEYETADLVSFISLGILCGWDFGLLPSFGYGAAFVSHDEWVEFSMDHEYQIQEIATEAEKRRMIQRR